MGFQIEVNTGEKGKVILRGTPEGYVDMGTMVDTKQKDGSTFPTFVGFLFFADMGQAINRVLAMRVCSSTTTTLEALHAEIKSLRAEIRKELGVF